MKEGGCEFQIGVRQYFFKWLNWKETGDGKLKFPQSGHWDNSAKVMDLICGLLISPEQISL